MKATPRSPYAQALVLPRPSRRLLAIYNAGVRAAVLANRDREKRERHLDSLWRGRVNR